MIAVFILTLSINVRGYGQLSYHQLVIVDLERHEDLLLPLGTLDG